MTTEEKARAYDEALKRAKAAIDVAADRDLVKGVASTIFPELRESEDERIRKGLVNFLQSPFIKENLTDEKVAPWVAYLEKQKESLHISETCKENADSFTDACKNAIVAIEKYLDWLTGYPDYAPKGKYSIRDMLYCLSLLEKQKEHQNEFDAHEKTLGRDLTFPQDKDKNLDEIAQDYVEGVKEYNSEPTWDLIQTAVCYGYHLAEQKEQKFAEWKPQPESLEALMYAIEGKWEMIKPTSYLSRRLGDLYEGLVNTYNVDETFLAELPKTAYTAKDIEELRALKDKIDASMDEKPAEWSEEDEEISKRIISDLRWERRNTVSDKDIRQYDEEINWMENKLKFLRPSCEEQSMKDGLSMEGEVISIVIAIILAAAMIGWRLDDIAEAIKEKNKEDQK